MSKTNVVRCVGYVRVSTDDQAGEDKTSLADQERVIREDISARGWKCAGIFSDPGVSGTALDRPGLDALRETCRRKGTDYVMVKHIDRLARKELVRLILIDEWQTQGIHFIALNTPDLDYTSEEGEFIGGIQGLVAQKERRRILDRMNTGAHNAAAHKNVWPCAKLPFGYRHRQQGIDATLVPDEAQHAIVRDTYTWLVHEGLTLGQICQRLNAEDRLTVEGKQWTHTNMRHKLISKGLLGEFWWGKTTGKGEASGKYGAAKRVTAEPLVTEDEFNAIQRALELTAKKTRDTTSRIYPLSGRVWCPCGGTLTGTWRRASGQRNTIQYRCRRTKWDVTTGKVGCNAKRIKAEWLEGIVWGAVVDMVGTPEQLHALFERYASEAANPGVDAGTEQGLNGRVAKLERALSRAQKERLMSDDPHELDDVVADLRADLKRVRDELEAVQGAARAAVDRASVAASLAELAAAVGPGLAEATPTEQAEIMSLLGVRVDVGSMDDEYPLLKLTGMIDVSELIDGLPDGTGAVAPVHPGIRLRLPFTLHTGGANSVAAAA